MTNDTLHILYKQLADVPINDNEEIDEDWYEFKKGTHREDIWTWFDEQYYKLNEIGFFETLYFNTPTITPH